MFEQQEGGNMQGDSLQAEADKMARKLEFLNIQKNRLEQSKKERDRAREERQNMKEKEEYLRKLEEERKQLEERERIARIAAKREANVHALEFRRSHRLKEKQGAFERKKERDFILGQRRSIRHEKQKEEIIDKLEHEPTEGRATQLRIMREVSCNPSEKLLKAQTSAHSQCVRPAGRGQRCARGREGLSQQGDLIGTSSGVGVITRTLRSGYVSV
eukprot:768106-Hanusia_phi.AAC.1